MTIKEAKAIDMVSYLSMRGYEPAKIKGNNYWYHSPLRNEKTPSFKVDRLRNQWYDFGEGKSGDIIDFVQQWKGCSIQEALTQLNNFQQCQQKSIPLIPAAPGIEVLSTYLVSSFDLVRYYRSRRIADVVAEQYLKEVRYKNGDKTYYALGFKNNAGGYELRSRYFKGSCHPKAPTLIKKESQSLAVFEGFFDFLSYCTIHLHQSVPTRDFLILNSTSFFETQLPLMQEYKRVHLYLDNDNIGNKYTEMAISFSPDLFADEGNLYKGYKDINEWHQYIGKSPKPAA